MGRRMACAGVAAPLTERVHPLLVNPAMTHDKRTAANHPRWTPGRRAWPRGLALLAVLALVSAWPGPPPAAAEGPARPVASAAAGQTPRQRVGRSLEDRVRSLSKALDLDASQEAELRKVLLTQREETLQAWADESTPPAVRVKATELIGQRTADRIRSLLTEQQRRKYNPARAEHQAEPGAARPSLEAWMNPPASKVGAP